MIFVLILWMAAIGLFFHRWGKIRNCEPYTPKFEVETDHRGSCHDQANLINKRMSMSNKLSTPGPSLPLTSNPNSFSKGTIDDYTKYLFEYEISNVFQVRQLTHDHDRTRYSSLRFKWHRLYNLREERNLRLIYILWLVRIVAKLSRNHIQNFNVSFQLL